MQVISYTRQSNSGVEKPERVNLDSLYRSMHMLLQGLDRFSHEDMLKIASAMDVVKRLQHKEVA